MIIRTFGAAVLLAGSCSLSWGATEVRLEVTPFAGYQFGGEFDLDPNTGTTENLDIRDAANYGFLVSAVMGKKGAAGVGALYVRQDTVMDSDPFAGSGETDLRVEYYQFEGRYAWPRGISLPFVSASVGITRYEAVGFDSDTRPSGTIAGGLILQTSKHVGLRFEGRYYGTLIERDDVEICDDDDEVCFRYEQSTLQSQYDLKGGLVIAF
jgi:hypothetical protein